MNSKCLIVDQLHDNIHALLKAAEIDYDYLPEIDRATIKTTLPNYEGLIIRSKTRVDQELIGEAPLKYVARAGAGVDNLDEEFLQNRGIAIINAPEGNRDAVGEHTIGLILNLLHNLHQGNHEVKLGEWQRESNRGHELGNMTVGIIGLGNSGSAVAHKLKGFGCQILAYDNETRPGMDKNVLTEMKEIFEKADILTLHIPLTAETKHLITPEYLGKFKKPIYFINVSRGEIAPLSNLRHGLATGRIIKAGLDVLECENFSQMSEQQRADFQWLRNSGRVIFTPHVAGWSFESYARINEVLVEKIGHFLDTTKK